MVALCGNRFTNLTEGAATLQRGLRFVSLVPDSEELEIAFERRYELTVLYFFGIMYSSKGSVKIERVAVPFVY